MYFKVNYPFKTITPFKHSKTPYIDTAKVMLVNLVKAYQNTRYTMR